MKQLIILAILSLITSAAVHARCQVTGTVGVDFILAAYEEKNFTCEQTEIYSKKPSYVTKESAITIGIIQTFPTHFIPGLEETIYECQNDEQEISSFKYFVNKDNYCNDEEFLHFSGVEIISKEKLPWWGNSFPEKESFIYNRVLNNSN